MKRHASLILCALSALLLPVSAQAALPTVAQSAERTEFTKSIEDLPVMKGLEVVEDKDLLVLFGDARIAETTLKGRVDVDSVYYFYRDTLPSLGWTPLSMKLYERGEEYLHLEVNSANREGMTYVTFSITPIGD